MHNYSRFEDIPLDTSLYDLRNNFNPMLRNDFAYEHTGNLGHAAQNMDFFNRPGTDQFLFGTALYPYLANPDRTVFYNTRQPFTEIIYSNILGVEWNEETIRFLHTQNIDPFSNIGIDFEVLTGKELYNNEETRATKFTLFGSRAKDKYSAFGTIHFNRFNNKENGGLENPGSFIRDSLQENWQYPVQLEDAASSYTKLQLFYTQKFSLSQKQTFTDTLGVTTDSGRNISLNHQLIAERHSRSYEDRFIYPNVPSFYDNFYYYNGEVKDSVVYDKITNTLQFILGDPYTDQLSARIYAGHELSRYGQRSPEVYRVFSEFDTIRENPLVLDSVFKDTASQQFSSTLFNDLFIGFHMAGPPENKWYWNVDGKYYLAGYFRNNFTANATFARALSDSLNLGIKGSINNRNVSYYHNNYSSAFFRWENDFKASQLIRGEMFLANPWSNFEASVTAGLLTNYIYWDQNALPAQYENAILIFSGKIVRHFNIAGFHSHHQLLAQYTTADDVLRLPLIAYKTSNYWEQVLFNGALTAQVGFDVFITTPYSGNGYMPATGVFYLKDEFSIGGFPFVDAFLALQIKRTRIFASFNNGFAGILGNNYFTAAEYPTKPAFFRLGIAWTFYD